MKDTDTNHVADIIRPVAAMAVMLSRWRMKLQKKSSFTAEEVLRGEDFLIPQAPSRHARESVQRVL